VVLGRLQRCNQDAATALFNVGAARSIGIFHALSALPRHPA
jgi:hypothetical protein